MDIIDIMLAKALTPQGQVSTYAAKAHKAAQDAADAAANASAAATALENAAQTKLDAENALATVQLALEAIENTNTQNTIKLYTSAGTNEDGAMTQKAVTEALAQKADASTLNNYASIQYVDNAITSNSGNSSTATTNLGSENNGRIVIVDNNGNISAGTVTEEDIVSTLILSGGYNARNAVGLEIDYNNKSFKRIQLAENKSMGTDFNDFIMYGGRRRCTVNDDGSIDKFYGEVDYTEDSANKQVMIYQPKFYYQRIPLEIENNKVGKIINKDSIIISSTPQSGFKVHPLFINEDGEEVDYVLLGAYEGGLYSVSSQGTYRYVTNNVDFLNDKLVSKANVKPITGSSGLNMQKAEQLANNRGSGWHIYTIEAESANQMLEIIEFGTMNGQATLGKGISNITTSGNYNQAALTGSTSSLGNTSGAASTTTIETNSETYTETTNGKVAISYRGMENPWGNTWTMLNGIIIYGNSASNGGVPYICNNYNYSYTALNNDYESVDFSLPNDNGWISAMGYGKKKYDWLFMPASVNNNNANSNLPVGDNGWFDANLSGIRAVLHGGGWSFEESNGPFYYACDHAPNDTSYKSYGTRLMFIPTKNAIYTANITKWQNEMNIGG